MASLKAQTYASHLQGSLIPSLEAARLQGAQITRDIAEYRDLGLRLRDFQKAGDRKPERPLKAQFELGGGLWSDAIIPDVSTVTVDIGLDVHVNVPVGQAIELCEKRVGVLEKKRSAVQSKEEQLVWQIEQFQGALDEVSGNAKA